MRLSYPSAVLSRVQGQWLSDALDRTLQPHPVPWGAKPSQLEIRENKAHDIGICLKSGKGGAKASKAFKTGVAPDRLGIAGQCHGGVEAEELTLPRAGMSFSRKHAAWKARQLPKGSNAALFLVAYYNR